MSKPEIKVAEIADQAMARLHSESLPPLPDIFELFYIYYSGSNPEVRRSVDIMVSQNIKLTTERCQELHKKLIDSSNHTSKETLARAEQIIGMTLDDVGEVFEIIRDSNQDFSGSMAHINDVMLNAIQAEQFKELLRTVMQEAQKMVSENSILERKLEKSTTIMHNLKEEMELIRQEAFTDALTGIPNRKKFEFEIERLVAESREEITPLSLIFIDIDHFKSFNDTFGHQIGDMVLRLVAKSLKDSLKGQDFPCRYGGEEFVIILPKTPISGAVKIADILREQIRSKDIKNRTTGEKLSRISISCGVAQLKNQEEIDHWIERADRALYKAKQEGRNRVIAAE